MRKSVNWKGPEMLIAGDIGGAKTDLAIFSSETGPHAPLAELKVHSADYPSLQTIVKEFMFNTTSQWIERDLRLRGR